jgi:phosphocarrier protein HPr
MTSCEVQISNRLGLHARAAAKFVHLATRFQSRIRVSRNQRVIDGKSIMGILLLAAPCGAAITISAEGPDEAEAVAELCKLVKSGFGESSTWNA